MKNAAGFFTVIIVSTLLLLSGCSSPAGLEIEGEFDAGPIQISVEENTASTASEPDPVPEAESADTAPASEPVSEIEPASEPKLALAMEETKPAALPAPERATGVVAEENPDSLQDPPLSVLPETTISDTPDPESSTPEPMQSFALGSGSALFEDVIPALPEGGNQLQQEEETILPSSQSQNPVTSPETREKTDVTNTILILVIIVCFGTAIALSIVSMVLKRIDRKRVSEGINELETPRPEEVHQGTQGKEDN